MQLLSLMARCVSWHRRPFRKRKNCACYKYRLIREYASRGHRGYVQRTRDLARSREGKGERKSRIRGTSAKYDVVRSLRPKKTDATCYFLPRARRAVFGHARIINDLAENYDHKGHVCC